MTFDTLIVLAQGNGKIADMGSRFRGGSSVPWSELVALLIVLVVVIAIVAAVGWYLHMRDRRSFRSPRQLFASLCQAHHLKAGDRYLLRKLAAARQLYPAAQLFLTPASFAVEDLPGWESRAERVETLRAQLFDSGSEEESN